MSFYSMIFGKNLNSEVILSLIGLKEWDIERFRDCGITENEIYVYTRTGGGNREDYPNEVLTSNPWYKYDVDDDYDSTYATYHFSIPQEIENDVEGLFNPKEKGISANLISWIAKTSERPKTDDDKRHQTYENQERLVRQLQQTMDVSTAFNGHTVIPLSDRGMDLVLNEMEKNNGKFIAYWYFMPYKFKVMQNKPKWSFDYNQPSLKQDQVRLGIDIIWEIDQDAWKRYQDKFGDKYPKSIAYIKEQIDEK